VDALPQSVRASCFDGGQSVTQHRGEDLDHLPVAVLNGRELAPDPVDRTGQDPVLKGRTVAQGARLASQYRDIVPGIIDGLVAAIAAGMLADDTPVLAQLDPIGIGARNSSGCWIVCETDVPGE